MTRSLARRTIGPGGLFVFAVGASSPLTVLVGGIPSTYALTGVVGVPLAFGLVAAVLMLLRVGYTQMSVHMPSPGPVYTQAARGLGRAVGLATAAVAFVGYNCIQISLYDLVGTTLQAVTWLPGSWQAWAFAVWALVGLLGLLGGAWSARVLGVFLAVEVGVIALFIIGGLAHPAQGSFDLAGLEPGRLFTTGVSGVLALSLAAFVGAEVPVAFGEEAIPRADGLSMRAAVLFMGGFYLLAALAYEVWAGPAGVVDAARSPDRQPLGLLAGVFGPGVANLAEVFLVSSVIVSMLAFHGTVSRYVFALARDKVLPSRLLAVSRAGDAGWGGAPVAGSLVQSGVAAIVLGVFVAFHTDPMKTMFTWLSTLGAVCILVLLIASALAARAFFAHGGGRAESLWVRQIAPTAGAVLGALLLVMLLGNLSALLGTPPGSWLPWLIPAITATAALIGLAGGVLVRRLRRHVWDQIGWGGPDPHTVTDDRLALLDA